MHSTEVFILTLRKKWQVSSYLLNKYLDKPKDTEGT
jgi:hypothetical protein